VLPVFKETILGPSPRAFIRVGKKSARRVQDDASASGRPKSLNFIGQGATNAEIAHALCLSEGTVKNNVSQDLQKLGLGPHQTLLRR